MESERNNLRTKLTFYIIVIVSFILQSNLEFHFKNNLTIILNELHNN